MTVHMLTTIDNPYNPFNEFDAWYMYDLSHGYDSLGLLARVANTSDDLSEADQVDAIELAIEEIVVENVSGLHLKVESSTE
jgi:hypothetical protein